jgi:hypothetical protein
MHVVAGKTVVGLKTSCRKTLRHFHEVRHTFALLDVCDVQQKKSHGQWQIRISLYPDFETHLTIARGLSQVRAEHRPSVCGIQGLFRVRSQQKEGVGASLVQSRANSEDQPRLN